MQPIKEPPGVWRRHVFPYGTAKVSTSKVDLFDLVDAIC